MNRFIKVLLISILALKPLSIAQPFDGMGSAAIAARDDTSVWHLIVEVGNSAFDIGDQDATTFRAQYMEPACSDLGCDSGSPKSFSFVTPSGGHTSQGTSTIQMSGFINNDSSVHQMLLTAINTAMLTTGQCTKVSSTKCANDPEPLNPQKRETGPIALNCGTVNFGHCTIANFIQATLYDSDSNTKAQMKFEGSSVEPEGFNCNSFLGGIQGALDAIPLADMVGQIINGVKATCGVFGI